MAYPSVTLIRRGLAFNADDDALLRRVRDRLGRRGGPRQLRCGRALRVAAGGGASRRCGEPPVDCSRACPAHRPSLSRWLSVIGRRAEAMTP